MSWTISDRRSGRWWQGMTQCIVPLVKVCLLRQTRSNCPKPQLPTFYPLRPIACQLIFQK
jgi:hypothetical protein